MIELKVKNGQIRGFRKFISTKATEFLKDNPDQQFTANRIAAHLLEKHPELRELIFQNSDVVSDESQLMNRLVARISQFRDEMNDIRITEEKPRKFWFSNKTEEDEVAEAENNTVSKKSSLKTSEHDLYPILSDYLMNESGLFSKRIDEKRSKNNRGPNGNRWLYPDIVSIEILSSDWHREIKDCAKQCSDKQTKLWSFEVKKLINRSNIREVFSKQLVIHLGQIMGI